MEESLYTLYNNYSGNYNANYSPYDKGFEGCKPTEVISEQIKLNRLITRDKKVLLDKFNIDYYTRTEGWEILQPNEQGVQYAVQYQDNIVGLSKEVHEVLGWSVGYVTKLENHIDTMTILNDTIRWEMAILQSEKGCIERELQDIRKLSLWGRIVKVFKGY